MENGPITFMMLCYTVRLCSLEKDEVNLVVFGLTLPLCYENRLNITKPNAKDLSVRSIMSYAFSGEK